MALRAQRIAENLGCIRTQVDILAPLSSSAEALKDVLSDPLRLGGVKYALQTAIESVIDSMYHIAAQVFHLAPASAQDAADILMENKVVSPELHRSLVRMIGFQSRLVHNYQRIDLAILESILRENLAGFRAWGQAMLPWLAEAEQE